MKKNFLLTLGIIMLSLLTISCSKNSSSQTQSNETLNENEIEALSNFNGKKFSGGR